MQQSSGSIGSLAAALARAQVELINPEKSMVATIRPEGRGAAEQIFRYAPLSDGLNIIRKTLGQHEIATLQSTLVDQTAGLIRLKTVLAHSSGEWISSDWPVCPLEDMASPKRMGAALTYARRYALFALVGIAGEDDLDAPDLHVAEPVDARGTHAVSHHRPRPNGGDGQLGQRLSAKPRAEPGPAPADLGLRRKLSAVLRHQLLRDVENLNSAEGAAVWARRILPAKNTLHEADARQVEEAFEAKLTAINGRSNSASGSDWLIMADPPAALRESVNSHLLNPVVQEFVSAALVEDEPRTDGVPERSVDRRLCFPVNQGQRGDPGDVAQAGELLQGF